VFQFRQSVNQVETSTLHPFPEATAAAATAAAYNGSSGNDDGDAKQDCSDALQKDNDVLAVVLESSSSLGTNGDTYSSLLVSTDAAAAPPAPPEVLRLPNQV
jgi:hypothetical protein